jgi:hypothetical protein
MRVAWQQVFDVDINYYVRDNVDVFRLQAAGAERHNGSPSQGVRCLQKDEQNVSIREVVFLFALITDLRDVYLTDCAGAN